MALRGSQCRNRFAQCQNNGNTCKFVLSPSCLSLCPLVSLILPPLYRISYLCGAQHRTGDRKIGYHYWNTLRNKSLVKWIIVGQLEIWESENQLSDSCWRSEGTWGLQTPWLALTCPAWGGISRTLSPHTTAQTGLFENSQMPFALFQWGVFKLF